MNIERYEKLSRSFYIRANVVEIAKDLVCKYIFTQMDGNITAGRIVETEAYDGRNDRACHAFLKRTNRTQIMYGQGGVAYVYLCYGIHHLFNIVTNKEGLADAVLIRAIEPVFGLEIMMARGNKNNLKRITSGPGLLSQALGITVGHYGEDLLGNQVWLTEGPQPKNIIADRRIGVDYAGEDAKLPWRFFEKDCPWISKGKQKLLA